MRALLACLLIAVPALAAGHSNGQCLPHVDTVLLGDGTLPGSLHWRRYGDPGKPVGGVDWLYSENGRMPGIQNGNSHVVFGSTWGHDHFCYYLGPDEDRDFMLY